MRIKILTSLSILILIFAGCTSVEYQQMQNERDQLRAVYEESRREKDILTLKNTLAREIQGTWQFLDIELLEGDLSNEIKTAAVALAALSRKDLTIRFFEQSNVRFYEGNNGSTNVAGEWSIAVMRITEELIPLVKLDRDSGIAPEKFLFNRQRVSQTLISVQDDRLYLTVGYGQLLTPAGWAQVGGSRYSFKRIK